MNELCSWKLHFFIISRYLFESKCRSCSSGYLRKAFTPSDELREGDLHNHSTNSSHSPSPLCRERFSFLYNSCGHFLYSYIQFHVFPFDFCKLLTTFQGQINSIIGLFCTWVAWMYNTVPVLNLKGFGQDLEVPLPQRSYINTTLIQERRLQDTCVITITQVCPPSTSDSERLLGSSPQLKFLPKLWYFSGLLSVKLLAAF